MKLTDKNGDMDLTIDFQGVAIPKYADNYFGLKYVLKKILDREVGLLGNKAIRNPYLRESIESSKKLIYG